MDCNHIGIPHPSFGDVGRLPKLRMMSIVTKL